jgi:hypothetical protein
MIVSLRMTEMPSLFIHTGDTIMHSHEPFNIICRYNVSPILLIVGVSLIRHPSVHKNMDAAAFSA